MILSSPLLSQFEWLEHGFGTRLDTIAQDRMASIQQVHSATVLVAPGPAGCAGIGDSLICNQPGTVLSVRTADCFPVLIADSRTHAVAAVHAGWRGTAAEILIQTLHAMREKLGTDPQDVFAVIGPGIGACCYQVGEEVALKFGRKKAGHLDLAAVNRRQLLMAGLSGEKIDAVGSCTYCDAENFYSFRRDKEQAGRMISYIGARKPPTSGL
jgi:YfiH family protein